MMWNTYSNTHALGAPVMATLIPQTYLRNGTAGNLTSPTFRFTYPWQQSERSQCQSSTTYKLLRFAQKMSDYSVSLDSNSCNVTQLMLPCLPYGSETCQSCSQTTSEQCALMASRSSGTCHRTRTAWSLPCMRRLTIFRLNVSSRSCYIPGNRSLWE